MGRRALFLALLVLSAPLVGCVDQGTGRLAVTLQDERLRWGDAAQLTLRNVGDGPVPAPVRVVVVSPNGTVVRTIEDATGGRGIPEGGQISVSWNGLNDAGDPVLWGSYRFEVPGHQGTARVELERPPHHAITVDPVPRTTAAGSPIDFVVNNTGTTWVNGSMLVAAGREDVILYRAEVEVTMPPGTSRTFFWPGKDLDGGTPEAKKYLVAVKVEPDDGPKPFAQDVFTLT